MAKTPNYTPEMETIMRNMYLANRDENQEVRDSTITDIVNALSAEPFEVIKEPKSIISKLSRMFTDEGEQLYVRKVTVSKVTGETPAKKADMAALLAVAVNADNPATVSDRKIPRLNPENVVKLNKSDIVALQTFVTRALAVPEVEPEVEPQTD